MRIVCVSDTHGLERRVEVPPGDVLIHAGDFSRGRGHGFDECVELNSWFEDQPHAVKILVPGNHDFIFEGPLADQARGYLNACNVLIDEEITVGGNRFWGSPWTPWFHDWAFNYPLTDDKVHWDKIPNGIDVVITHGPPLGIGDLTASNVYAGSKGLAERLNVVKPKLHVCGHIHEGRGNRGGDPIRYVNASVLDEKYRLQGPAIVADI